MSPKANGVTAVHTSAGPFRAERYIAALGSYTPVSDDRVTVPGSDQARRLVATFDGGAKRNVPTRRVLIVARKGLLAASAGAYGFAEKHYARLLGGGGS